MAQLLKLAVWNANGLCRHVHEVRTFLQIHNIDIMFISETHFTDKSYIRLPKYNIYTTNHPDGKAHGGTALIVKDDVKHYETDKYATAHLQATSVTVDINTGPFTISAVYCPPKHNNKHEHFEDFFLTLGNRFIAGGDYNAKHTTWGLRFTSSKGNELLTTLRANNLSYVRSGEPTYWPTDRYWTS